MIIIYRFDADVHRPIQLCICYLDDILVLPPRGVGARAIRCNSGCAHAYALRGFRFYR
jgi:hypothetical protein